MTGLPLDRPLIANQTEIANSDGAAGPSIPAIDYYQRVMSSYFETMGIPILQGRGFRVALMPRPADGSPSSTRRWRTPTGKGGIRSASSSALLRRRGNLVVHGDRRRQGRQAGGVDQPVGAEAYFLVDQLATDSPTTWVAFTPTTMHVVVRTTLPLATLAPTIARVVRDVDPSVPVPRLREMDEVFAESIRRPRLLAQLLAALRRSRCCSRPSAPTASSPTWWPNGAARSASAWRSVPGSARSLRS